MVDHDALHEQTKHVIDALSIGVTVGAITNLLPSIAAALTIVWTAIRIWETRTVRSFREYLVKKFRT